MLSYDVGANVLVSMSNHTRSAACQGGGVAAGRLCRPPEARAPPHCRLISATSCNPARSSPSRRPLRIRDLSAARNSTEKTIAPCGRCGANLVDNGRDFSRAREEAEPPRPTGRPGIRAVVPPRSRSGRRDLCARTVAKGADLDVLYVRWTGMGILRLPSWPAICWDMSTEDRRRGIDRSALLSLSFRAGRL